MKIVFVCSPYRADSQRQLDANIRKAQDACKKVLAEGNVPYAPHLFFPALLNDAVERERTTGIRAGMRMLECADELWIIGSTITEGMHKEIKKAERLGIPIIRKENETMEDVKKKNEALDILQKAMGTVDAAMDALANFAEAIGVEIPGDEEECGSICGFSYEEVANGVSERTGFCPHFVEEALRVAMDVIDEMAQEDDCDGE